MSDNFYGSIKIGGELPKELINEFLGKIEKDTGMNYGKLDRIPDNNGTLYIEDSEARNGQFDNLETWCQKHDLSYVRESSACYEYSAEVVWWIPGMEEAMVVLTTMDQEPYIIKDTLNRIINFLEKVKDPKDATLMLEDYKEWAMEVIDEGKMDPVTFMKMRIEEICPETPELPSFKIG